MTPRHPDHAALLRHRADVLDWCSRPSTAGQIARAVGLPLKTATGVVAGLERDGRLRADRDAIPTRWVTTKEKTE